MFSLFKKFRAGKYFLIFFLFLFFFNIKVYSQTPTSSIINCGYADVSGANTCCKSVIPNPNDLKQSAKDQLPDFAKPAVDILPNIDPKTLLGLDNINFQCFLGQPDTSSGSCICKQSNVPTPVYNLKDLCRTSKDAGQCVTCVSGGGIPTALGCVPLNFGNFVSDFLLGKLVGLAGIVALLCIIYASFNLQTSQGNPEKLKKAQELLISCIMGLMLIIFSVFILRLIGISILGIPGLK